MYVRSQEGVSLPMCAPLPTLGHPQPQSPEAKKWNHPFLLMLLKQLAQLHQYWEDRDIFM